MSDSEDDLSSGSITDADELEDDVDLEDGTIDDPPASDAEELDDEITDKKSEKYFRKEIWQLKKLPYYAEIEEEANKHFIMIKKGLADSVLLNDASVGFCHWVLELDKYIDLYGRRFSKEEHIQLIKLLLPLIQKKNIYRNVKIAMRCVYTLLCKKDYLTRNDLIIDWRPLYDLYIEVTFKNLEEDGLFLMPEGFRTDLLNLIFYARLYFTKESVQEILDECRPYMCIWDESCTRCWKVLDLFLCMSMSAEDQKVYGTALWFDEAWHWYETIDNNSIFETQAHKMFARLTYESPGLIDWGDKLDLIFTRLIRSLRLGLISGLCQSFSHESAAVWIIHMLGSSCHDQLMVHLKQLFDQIESFLHPSNNGHHTQYLITLISKLCTHSIIRMKRERNEKPNKTKTVPIIPDQMRLNQQILNDFVNMMLPSLKLMAFTKTSKELINPIYRNCCLMCPKIILPVVLDMVYPALETLVEPHRLQQTLGTLVGVLIPLVKDEPDAEGKTYRVHAITILNSLLPGLDCNDIRKCMVTYQIIGVLVNMIPLVDSSDAIHTRCDLTEDEKELCSATANFDSIISLVMDRMIEMLTSYGQSANPINAQGGINAKTNNANIEEQILHRGTLSVFKGICRNSSSEIFKIAMNKLYTLASENVFDSRIVNDVIADMIQVACRFHPDLAFNKFFNLVLSRLQNCITPEFYTDEKVDFSVLWWVTIAGRIVKVHTELLLKNWSQINVILNLLMPLKKCSVATEKVLSLFDNLLEQLTYIHLNSLAGRRKLYDSPPDQFLAIRYWAAAVDKKTYKADWFVPTQESIDKAVELMRTWLVPNLAVLNSPEGIAKKELLHRLQLCRSTILGSCMALPLLEGEYIRLTDSHVVNPDQEFNNVVKPKGTPEVRLDGKNVRQMVLDTVLGLIDYLLEHCPDDVKSIQEAVTILRSLPSNRGYTKDMYVAGMTSYKVTKIMLCDKLGGNKSNIEMIVEEYILLLHRKRMSSIQGWHFTAQHQRIFETLLKVSTSSYSENRAKAQNILLNKIRQHPYSYKRILDDILRYLDPANEVTHEQLKGALYLLIDGKKQAIIIRMEFEQQAKIWPALVRVQHSEKPSIIRLLENAQNLIVDNYESYRLKYEWVEANVEAAKRLIISADECSPLHDPNILKMPSQEQIDKYSNYLETKFEYTLSWYHTLIARIYELANDPTLHWRPLDMAHSMLSMQVRLDYPLPDGVIKMFVKLLVNDTVKTRRIASAVVASWLKIMKPKAVKHEYVIPNMSPNSGPGAKFPIFCGLREDNRCMMYEEDKLPQTDEEWNAFQFCGKQHWGLYTWPTKLRTYAPLNQQTAIDRNYEDFSETEKAIVDTFLDEKFMTRLRELFSIEMKKEDELFNAVHFSLFQGLFRVFNDVLCPAFKTQLEILLASTKEYDQKLASEMVAGIINGSKLWKYERQRKMWSWLGPLISKSFEVMKEDGLRNWGVGIATVCGCSEARMLKPLIDLLFKLIERPTDNAFAASSRLFLLQSALCQFEWRGMELWNRFMNLLKTSLVHQYQNLRDRVATALVSATWYDVPAVAVAPEVPEHLRPPRIELVSSWYEELLSTCWDEIRISKTDECSTTNGTSNGEAAIHVSASTASLTEISEVRKAARLALKSTISYVFNTVNQNYHAYPKCFIPFLPLWCHYANDVGDEELQRTCNAFNAGHMEAIYVSPSNAPLVLNQFQQILTSQCWWKSKVVALRTIRTLVFANPYVFRKHREDIGHLLVHMLNDCQIEVRERAAEALSTLLQSDFFETTQELVRKFDLAAASENPIEAHGGVLGLSAIVLASPYSVPTYLPDVLMRICRFATSKNATIRDAVKRALSEFKRTHQDSWREHETQFNEDQLIVLRNLLISPNYYV